MLVWVVACSLSAEVWTPRIEFILQLDAYFSPNIKDREDAFHLACPHRIDFWAYPRDGDGPVASTELLIFDQK